MSKSMAMTLDEGNVNKILERSDNTSWEVDRTLTALYSLYDHYDPTEKFTEEELQQIIQIFQVIKVNLRLANATFQSNVLLSLTAVDPVIFDKVSKLDVIQRLALIDRCLLKDHDERKEA